MSHNLRLSRRLEQALEGHYTGKHVYKHWTSIMEKRGAFNPLMDPFKMEANKDIVPDYKEDMCPAALDRLSKVVYVIIPKKLGIIN